MKQVGLNTETEVDEAEREERHRYELDRYAKNSPGLNNDAPTTKRLIGFTLDFAVFR